LVVASSLALLWVVVPPALAGEAAGDGMDRLAARLLRLDPGARLGGNTQMATAAGKRLLGVPGRENVMVGLGPRETIVGGARHDELGIRGAGGRIFGAGGPDLIHGGPGRDLIHGGPGRDLIYGGPGRDRLRGGPGRDRLIDGGGATTVRAGSGRDRVDVADGQGDDRVLCAAGSRARIEADRGDRIGPACIGRLSRVSYRRAAAGPPPARVAQQPVTGDGGNGNPFTAPCDNPSLVDCTVSSFAPRRLGGFWSNEYVPAYKCPADHPYLQRKSYEPLGTQLGAPGIEVQGLGPVGVSLSGPSRTTATAPPLGVPVFVATGTQTGFGLSSATNWDGEGSTYKVILHCTSLVCHAACQPPICIICKARASGTSSCGAKRVSPSRARPGRSSS